MRRDFIVWAIAITFGLSAVIWAACQFDFTCAPVDVRVVLRKPSVSQDNCLTANARDIEFGLALMTFVLDNEIDCFSNLSDLVWRSVCIIQPNQTWKLIGLKLMHLDKPMVNKFSRCATVYQCFHCQWMIAVNCMDLDRDVGGPPKYLVSKGLEDLLFPFHVSASLGVSDFDTTFSVVGGTFESNISLVDPTVQFSRTEKRLVKWGVSFTADPVKNPSLHLFLPPFASPDHRGWWLWLW